MGVLSGTSDQAWGGDFIPPQVRGSSPCLLEHSEKVPSWSLDGVGSVPMGRTPAGSELSLGLSGQPPSQVLSWRLAGVSVSVSLPQAGCPAAPSSGVVSPSALCGPGAPD